MAQATLKLCARVPGPLGSAQPQRAGVFLEPTLLSTRSDTVPWKVIPRAPFEDTSIPGGTYQAGVVPSTTGSVNCRYTAGKAAVR